MPGPAPSCTCNNCRTCYLRKIRRSYYYRNKEIIIQKNTQQQYRRRHASLEVSDEELDRRALNDLQRI